MQSMIFFPLYRVIRQTSMNKQNETGEKARFIPKFSIFLFVFTLASMHKHDSCLSSNNYAVQLCIGDMKREKLLGLKRKNVFQLYENQ